MYILFDKETKKVIGINNKPFVSYTSNLELAEYYGEIPKNDYLTVFNERQETKTFTEVKYEPKLDENGNYVYGLDGEVELLPITEEKTRTYLTCDLLANFYPPKTEEELALERKAKYEKLCEKYIRAKYSASDEFQILREYSKNPNDTIAKQNFDEYNTFVENCLLRAKLDSGY